MLLRGSILILEDHSFLLTVLDVTGANKVFEILFNPDIYRMIAVLKRRDPLRKHLSRLTRVIDEIAYI